MQQRIAAFLVHRRGQAVMLSPLRLLALWVTLLVALGSCSADTDAPDGAGGSGASDSRASSADGKLEPLSLVSAVRASPWKQQGLAPGLREAHLAAVQRNASAQYAVKAAGESRWRASNTTQRLDVELDGEGVHLEPSEGARWEMSLGARAVGCEGVLAPVVAAAPRGERNRIEYQRGGVVEWYLNGPLGLEQGFTLTEAPGCAGAKVIAVAARGTLVAEHVKVAGRPDEVAWRSPAGEVALRYTDLSVRDATGRALPAWLSLAGEQVWIHVDDAAAVYPVEVDPLVWTQESQLLAADGAPGDELGSAVSLSADGSTALVGSWQDDDVGGMGQGTAYVFVRSGGVWTEQAHVVASDGAASDLFGWSVSLSGDGSTALVGAPLHNVGSSIDRGSAYVFVRSGGVWTQQTQLLAVGSADNDQIGSSVSLSGDGSTALIGAPGDLAEQGSAYVFMRSGAVWTQQAQLVANDGAAGDLFGTSGSLSADGSTALVGAMLDDVGASADQGSAYVFVRSGGVWTQQTKLLPAGGAAGDAFGYSVSLSGDGSTALVGANEDDVGANTGQGSAYVFVRSGGVWTQEAQLLATDGAARDSFGCSVSLSADGTTVLVGAYYDEVGASAYQGSAYVFVRSGGVWTQEAQLLAADGATGDVFGWSVALSADGRAALVGARGDDVNATVNQGSAYVFIRQGGNGTPCAQSNDCASSFCADGVCCNTACNAGPCDACSVAAGGTTDGTCALLTGPACGDGNACNGAETCQVGACTTGIAITCNSPPACHTTTGATCVPATGACTYPDATNGTACNDNNLSTKNDVCTAGACAGVPLCTGVVCSASDQCHMAGTCDTTTGVCSNPNAADGVTCNDANALTKNDVCTAGACAGVPLCTGVVCSASDQCHVAGTCNMATGMCDDPAKADGTSCDDESACTTVDTCQAGSCQGASPVVCAALDDCHEVGACEVASGVCSNPVKADGTSCAIGTCQLGVCTAETDGGMGTGGMAGTGGQGGTGGMAGTGGVAGTGGMAGTGGQGGTGGMAGTSGSSTSTTGSTTGTGADTTGASTGAGGGRTEDADGCGCTVVGESESDDGGALRGLATAAVGLLVASRRRARRAQAA